MSASLTRMVDPALVLNAPGTGVCPDVNLILGPALCRTAGAPLKAFQVYGFAQFGKELPCSLPPWAEVQHSSRSPGLCLYPAIACICGIWCDCGPVCCPICYSQISVEVLVEKGIFSLCFSEQLFSLYFVVWPLFSLHIFICSQFTMLVTLKVLSNIWKLRTILNCNIFYLAVPSGCWKPLLQLNIGSVCKNPNC